MTVSIKNALDLIADENYLQAEGQLKQLIALSPDKKELYNLYAYCEDCIEEICEKEDLDIPLPVSLSPQKTPVWEKAHQDAQQFADKGDYKKAETLLGLLWDTPPLDPPYACLPTGLKARATMCKERAICHFLQGNLEGAKEQYIHSLDVELSAYPPNAPKRVPFLIKKKEYAEALRILQLGVPITQQAEIYYQQYQVYLLLNERAKAHQALENALKYMELETDARCFADYLYNQYADWLIEGGKFQEALRQNSKAIALWPKLYQHRLKRAEIYARLGQVDKAREQLALLDQGNWHRIESYCPAEKAKVYECMGDFTTAEKYYQEPTRRPLTRYDNLCGFYTRHDRKADLEQLRQKQRQEPRFQDRVSESELMALI